MPSSISNPRKAAVQELARRLPRAGSATHANGNGAKPLPPTSEYFGCNTFGAREMKARLPKDVYAKLAAAIRLGKKLDI